MKKNISNIAGKLEELASLDFLDLCPLGETGTGKTHTGKLIHDLSPRSGRPMVSVNCAELSPSKADGTLIEGVFVVHFCVCWCKNKPPLVQKRTILNRTYQRFKTESGPFNVLFSVN